jgi:adenylate cyclase
VNASVVARDEPVVYVIEDAHWMDPTSESLLADFLSVIPRAPALVLITYRPEYTGALSRSPGAQTIALAPLDDSQTAGLVADLLGRHPSVTKLANRVAERASGNPFFAEEIIRDLADRGVLSGERGAHTCADEAADVDVPATVQAAIAARIDRLAPDAKLALNAAAVIGLRFDEGLLAELADVASVQPLLDAELIDQLTFMSGAEYAFRHPLIRSVAYRSQLTSARAELHRKLAAALQVRGSDDADESAALIAEHLESAGDLTAAFGWHIRAGEWLRLREVHAASQSWRKARDVADRMSVDQPGRDVMRLAPRTLLCANAFRTGSRYDQVLFEEAASLADVVGDKISRAIVLSGRVAALTFSGNYRDASRIAIDAIAGIQSINDPELELAFLPTVMLPFASADDLTEFGRLADRVIALAEGDPRRGGSVIESPLSLATIFRAVVRMCQGVKGWNDDLAVGVEMIAEFAPVGLGIVMFWKYGYGVAVGAIRPDAAAATETGEVLQQAHRLGDNLSVEVASACHGFVLAQQEEPARVRGLELLRTAREAILEQRSITVLQPFVEIELARDRARRGDVDGAVQALRQVLETEFDRGAFGPHAFAVEALAEALLDRRRPGDVAAARDAVNRLAELRSSPNMVIYEVALLRLRALIAQASGDETEYRLYRDRHRAMANEIGFEGQIAKAKAMA